MTVTQPTSSVPAWRVAVIAFVAILAVGIGVVAGSAILNTRSALVGSGASYVPSTAPMYFEVRLEPSDAQDASLRELLGRFPEIEGVDLARPLYEQLTEKIDEAGAEGGHELSWSGDVAPWFDGRIGFAILDIPAQTMVDPMAAPIVPSMVATLGVTDRDAAEGAIARFRAEGPSVTFTEESHAGVTLNVADGDGFAYALTDDQFLFAPAAADLRAALDAHASSETTLGEAGEMGQLTEALPDDWLAFALYDFTDLVNAAFEEGAAAGSPGAEAFRELFENQPMRGAMAVTAGGDRMTFAAVTEPPTGPLAVENADRGLADEVPGDALVYTETGNYGATLAASIGPLKDSLASMPGGQEQVEMVEGALGADLEELVSWMGDTAIAAGWDGEAPYGGILSVPTDAAAAQRRLEQLTTFASLGAMDPASGITVESREVDGSTVTTIRVATAGMVPVPGGMDGGAPPEVVVEWTVTDDRALIGIGDRFVERVLTLDSARSLAEEDRYRAAVADLGGQNNAGVMWVDLRGIRTAVEAAFEAEISAAPEYSTAVQPWLEPLDRLVSVARLDGDRLVTDVVLLVD